MKTHLIPHLASSIIRAAPAASLLLSLHLLLLLSLLNPLAVVGQDTSNSASSYKEEGWDAFPSLDAILWQDAIEELRRAEEKEEPGTGGTGGINRFFTSEERPKYTPASSLSSYLVEQASQIDYAVGIESLYLIPKEKLDSNLIGRPRKEILLDLYRTLQSVSSLEGIEYYSASRERMRTLFAETWVIAGPEDEKRLPDPRPDSIPPEDTLYIHQEDLTFGENISKIVYRHEGYALSMSISNETTMRYMLFPLVREGNMSMQMLILPVREGILFYGLSTIDVLNLKVFYKKMRSSFTNRLVALKDWLMDQVGK